MPRCAIRFSTLVLALSLLPLAAAELVLSTANLPESAKIPTATAPTLPAAPAEPIASEQPAPTAAPATEYRFNYGDQVLISVFKQADLAFTGVIPPSGRIIFPMLGTLQMQGRTADEVAQEIGVFLKQREFVSNPFVVVQVTMLAPTYVYVRGAVARPAAIPMPVGQPLRLTQLLATAGGTLEGLAVKEKIQLIRYSADGKTATQIDVDLAQLDTRYDFRLDPLLQSGDEVFVPHKLPPRVIVIGAVNTPQTVPLAEGRKLTLSEAIAQCGGLREDADNANVQLQLAAATGKGLLALDLKQVLDGSLPDYELADGDRVYVPKVDGIVVSGRVKEPGVVYARPGVKMTVTRALSMSGGFISYASRNEVYVIRKGSQKPIPVDVGHILKTGDLTDDQELFPGDMVIVPEGIW